MRTAWVFGQNGNNFVKTMLNVGKKYDTLKVVNDQIGTPTYTYGLNKANRPHNSRLDKSKLAEAGFIPLPIWQDALRRFLGTMGYRGYE